MSVKSALPKAASPAPASLDSFCYGESRHLLLFTQADGTTTGFPITWLYQIRRETCAGQDRLTIFLTEHRVMLEGRMMDRLLDQLRMGEGFHASERPERYASIRRSEDAYISKITIEPLSPNVHQGN